MSDAKTIATYEAQAAKYAALPVSPTQQRAIDQFLSTLPDQAHILDLGCGPGLHAALMVAAGHDVDAIDATQAFVDAAISHGVTARLATFDDITGTDIYDGVYASFSLLHAPLADLPRHLSALTEALKLGGTIFIGMKSGIGEDRDTIGRRYSYVTEDEMRGMLEDLGVTIIHVETGREAGLSGEVAPFFLMHGTLTSPNG